MEDDDDVDPYSQTKIKFLLNAFTQNNRFLVHFLPALEISMKIDIRYSDFRVSTAIRRKRKKNRWKTVKSLVQG